MNQVYLALIDAQIRAFATEFADTARHIFFDDAQGRLIHPGEYGGFREALVRDLLTRFLPEAYGVSQGFVISPLGEVSTQCDVVIYSRLYAPVIRTPEQQRFFPVESVVAVGEVKSDLNATRLRAACEKLATVKQMRASLPQAAIAQSLHRDVGLYAPTTLLLDQIATFIVANRIDATELACRESVEAGAREHSPAHRINLLLSIGEYCTAYRDLQGLLWPYPVDVDPATKRVLPNHLQLEFMKPGDAPMFHIRRFLYFMQLLVTRATVLYPDLAGYWE